MHRRRLLALGIAWLSVLLGTASVAAVLPIDPPAITPFYDAPVEIPHEPGSLIRFEPIDEVKAGDAHLYRILYTSTDVNETHRGFRDAGRPGRTSTERWLSPHCLGAWHGGRGA